ncbi:MAG: 2Fe-2S iron-sulfur cluster-binding protein [Pseudoxanthomonas sp.]
MPTVTYIESNGTRHEVEVETGQNLMQAALDNLIPGIIGDCGGVCSCATCHLFVDVAWRERLPPRGTDETLLLEGVPEVREESRLGCQIRVREDLDGLVVYLPVEQY